MQVSEEMTAPRRLGDVELFVMRRAPQNEITTRPAERRVMKPQAKLRLKKTNIMLRHTHTRKYGVRVITVMTVQSLDQCFQLGTGEPFVLKC